MMGSRILFLISVLLGGGGLAVLYGLEGVWSLAVLVGALGMAWALPDLLPAEKKVAWLRAGWLSNGAFMILSLAAVGLLWVGRPWWLAAVALCVILAAWDLRAFRLRIYPAEKAGAPTVLLAYRTARPVAPGAESHTEAAAKAENAAFERAHLRALGLATLASLTGAGLVSLLAGLIRFQLGLGLAFGLTLALVLGLLLLARLALRP